MLEPTNPSLSLSRQCKILAISRSTAYYRAKGESAQTLALMRKIDELFMACPFYGSRQMRAALALEGISVGRHRVRRLMALMGLQAIYQRPNTSKPHPEHRIYSYKLRGLKIARPNHVWCTDITYIPMQRGFLYLVVAMDWATRKVLSWRLSNTLDTRFCLEALDEAIAKYGPPEIFNSDQGSQFTSLAFTSRLKQADITISMDGRGRYLDNIFIERLWRSLKYEAVYLYAMDDGFTAKRIIGDWISFYNKQRPHSALDGTTPNMAYRTTQTRNLAA